MERADLELFERSLRHATEEHSGDDLDEALDELGWSDALADDPRAAVSILFRLQGEANVTSSALDRVLLPALGLDVAADAGVVLPPIGRWDAAGEIVDGVVRLRGVGHRSIAAHASAIAPTLDGVTPLVVVLPVDELSVQPLGGVDPASGLVEVAGDRGAVASAPAAVDWEAALALARLALGHELIGASRRMLEMAREHALERIQFGVPISSFQAVRHRLAETLVAIETAEAVLDAAWIDGSPLTAAMAKAVAGRSARTASRHCQQVLAGIGFTTEHPFHLYFRRVLVLDGLLGSARSLTRQLGQDLIASRRLPPLLPL